MSMDFKVTVRGLTPGASGIALPEADRSFLVYEQESQRDAERAALRVAKAAGVEHAYVVRTERWFAGPVEAPQWGGPLG